MLQIPKVNRNNKYIQSKIKGSSFGKYYLFYVPGKLRNKIKI